MMGEVRVLYRKPYIAMITATNAHLISMTSVSELEYIKFMLVAMKKIDKELFDDLHDQFVQLDPTGDGQITKSDLILLTKRKMKSLRHKMQLSEYKVCPFSEWQVSMHCMLSTTSSHHHYLCSN